MQEIIWDTSTISFIRQIENRLFNGWKVVPGTMMSKDEYLMAVVESHEEKDEEYARVITGDDEGWDDRSWDVD